MFRMVIGLRGLKSRVIIDRLVGMIFWPYGLVDKSSANLFRIFRNVSLDCLKCLSYQSIYLYLMEISLSTTVFTNVRVVPIRFLVAKVNIARFHIEPSFDVDNT